MEISRELQEYHLERLEALMDQWTFSDDLDIEPITAMTEIVQSGRGSERVAKLQGGLGEMRQSLSDIFRKPGVYLPTIAVALGGMYHLANVQMTPADLEFMRDTNAIAIAEFEKRYEEAKIAVDRSKEITLGLLGLGSATTAFMNADRIKAFLTGKNQADVRERGGAAPGEERLSSRLTDGERAKLHEVIAAFNQMAQGGNEEAKAVTLNKLFQAIGRTERDVIQGSAPANEILARLEEIGQRISAINSYTANHEQRSVGHVPQSPGL